MSGIVDSKAMKSMDFKIFNDAVHGPMSFHPLVVVVTDTPQIQRLRNIKQLGACYFVFPSATHTRFEHSLGTAFIAGKLFDSIKQKGIPAESAEARWDKLKLCAQIAGICHDAGHGPFSHAWETFREKCGFPFNHVEESVKIFDEILKEEISPTKLFGGRQLKKVNDVFAFYELTSDYISLIKKMILGQKEENNYLYQVIANETNNVDVDKWDYIARDSLMLNIRVAFDFNRLLNYCRVMRDENGDEQICFLDKECMLLEDMFLARGKLHDSGYQHIKVKIIEEMLLDAFFLAKDRLNLIQTPITQLTDHIYQRILFDYYGNDENMIKSRNILMRIEKRHLYKVIASQKCQQSKKSVKLRRVRAALSSIPKIEPYINDIGITSISIDMTKSNKKKGLSNVLVYEKVNGQDSKCRILDWDKYQESLKHKLWVFKKGMPFGYFLSDPKLMAALIFPYLVSLQNHILIRENLKRNQIYLLYKGNEVFPETLIPQVNEAFQHCLLTRQSN